MHAWQVNCTQYTPSPEEKPSQDNHADWQQNTTEASPVQAEKATQSLHALQPLLADEGLTGVTPKSLCSAMQL